MDEDENESLTDPIQKLLDSNSENLKLSVDGNEVDLDSDNSSQVLQNINSISDQFNLECSSSSSVDKNQSAFLNYPNADNVMPTLPTLLSSGSDPPPKESKYKFNPDDIGYSEYSSKNSSSQINQEPIDHLDSQFHLDLGIIATQAFESENETELIPPRILDMITEPNGSIVYTALTGADISGYNKDLIDEAILCLKFYQSECIRRGYIAESSYIQNILDTLNQEQKELQKFNVPSLDEAEDQFDEAVNQLQKKEAKWKNAESKINAEEKIALDSLSLKHQNDIEDLNKEWSSDIKLCQFNKPSRDLIEMRQSVKKLMKMRCFDEAQQLSIYASKREQKEQKLAASKMQEAYQLALSNLEKRYQVEVDSTKQAYQRKRNLLTSKKKVSLDSLGRRVSICEKEVEKRTKTENDLAMTQKKFPKNSTNQTSQIMQSPLMNEFKIRKSSKLNLPQLRPLLRTPLSKSRYSSKSSMEGSRYSSSISSSSSHSRPKSRMQYRISSITQDDIA